MRPTRFGEDCAGIRDIDYTADIGSLEIPRGQTTGTTTLTVNSFDNDEEDGAKIFLLKAFLGDDTAATAKFEIADDELPTTLITLCAIPNDITSGTGKQSIEVRATLNGKVFDEKKKPELDPRS